MNLKSLPQRLGSSSVVVIGIAGVVAVLVSMLAMSTGMLKTLQNNGRNDRVVVLRTGSTAEAGSAITRDAARLVADSAGVKRDAEGRPIASSEALRLVNVRKRKNDAEVSVGLRGVGARLSELRPELQVIEGRMFRPAVNEVIVGKGAHSQFKGLEIGDTFKTQGAIWTVVGVFETGGDSHESEMITDIETFNSAERRGGNYQSVRVMLESEGAFRAFKDSITSNPALAVDVMREPEYYARQSETIGRVISVVAYVVGGIMAVGAIFSALNTMYSAVSSRVRDIATLRALGFGSAAMVISVLVEALLLALLGGLLGSMLAWLFFNGNTVTTISGMGQLVFDLTVSPQLVLVGIVWACTLGLIGGLFPAVRAARLPVATALRAV